MTTENLFEEKLPGLHHTVGFLNPLEKKYQPLMAVKSFHHLMADHPKWQMKIVGYGSLYGDIQTYVKENDLGNKIMLYGPLSYNEIYDVFKRVDVVVVPSSSSDENDMTMAISAIGAPMVLPQGHKMLGDNRINQALILHDETESGLSNKLELAINSIQSFNNAFIRDQRLLGLLNHLLQTISL